VVPQHDPPVWTETQRAFEPANIPVRLSRGADIVGTIGAVKPDRIDLNPYSPDDLVDPSRMRSEFAIIDR
jgi:hypothetical protein